MSANKAVQHRFVADALEAGYVWDTHLISVGNKQVRRPKKDGWYEHGMNCLEYVEHNFGGAQPTLEQTTKRAMTIRERDLRHRQVDRDPYDAIMRRQARGLGGRAGY